MKAVPASVYRLQLNEETNIKKIIELLPYFEALGIDGLYLSPIFDAETAHGYDIVNPNHLNPKLGSMAEFETLCQELKKREFKLVLDIVPNHMSIKGIKNTWWVDVLKNGPHALYADFFDIDWNPEKLELKDKVLLPILGNPYGQTLLNQEIQLLWEQDNFWIGYHEYRLPLSPHSYSFITKSFGKEIDEQHDLLQIFTLFNGKKGDHHSFDLLHALLEKQFYRLAFWQVAGQEINYRRFFNINALIAIQIEKEKVLQAHHSWLFQLLVEEKVQGLRIDHPDGLYNPTQYFDRLQAHNPAFVVIEKILDVDELLPHDFNVDGTVGYEYLNVLSALFIDKTKKPLFDKIYSKFIGMEIDFDLLLYQRKKKFLTLHMGGELQTLGWRLERLTEKNRYYRDFTRVDLTHALGEIIACFPVYRTYLRAGHEIAKKDKDYIVHAVEMAKSRNPTINTLVYDYIRDLLLTELRYSSEEHSDEKIDFIFRFQQQTAPVMAKGLEDSTFYIFNRFISLNEVGGNPKQFGISKSEFHQFNLEKLSQWPLGFLPTTTHDTKRSNDARMRLNVLSEIPKEWGQLIKTWGKENQKYKKKISGEWFPDRNTEYYIYQILIGIWPDDPEEASSSPFFERLWGCILKSIREAGILTGWVHHHVAYETAVHDFLASLIKPEAESLFYPSFLNFQKKISHYGRLNSLSSLILRTGSCGILDLYQGNEWWQYTLMDPDNRRPINYTFLTQELHQMEQKGYLPDYNKLWVTSRALQFRRLNKELFLQGEYIPIASNKKYKDHIVAFMRRHDQGCALIAAARFFTRLPAPPTGESWGDTELILPKNIEIREFYNIFSTKTVIAKKTQSHFVIHAADLFETAPFAILSAHNKSLA